MPSLHEIFLRNGEKRIHKWVHYFDIYENHFRRFVGKSPTILEIGVQGGGSLQMWREYFGEGAKIVGLDINPKCKEHEGEGIEIVIGSQSDPKVFEELMQRYKFDIVIDDGSHQMNDIKSSFELLYDSVDAKGVYLVEDLQCSYWAAYGGGLRKEGSFIEFVKSRLDELHAAHIRDASMAPTKFTASTACIAVYDSIVVFEKAPQGRRHAVVTNSMDHDVVDPEKPALEQEPLVA